MQQETPDELVGRQGHRFDLTAIPIILLLETHLMILDIEQAVVGNRDAVRISAHVIEHLLRAGGGTFRTADLYAPTLEALGCPESQYSLASLRYDLSKLRAKKLVERVPKTRRYRLIGKGYSICVVFLKLFETIYAPLTAGLLKPFPGDRQIPNEKRTQLDRLYQSVKDDLDQLLKAAGLKIAA